MKYYYSLFLLTIIIGSTYADNFIRATYEKPIKVEKIIKKRHLSLEHFRGKVTFDYHFFNQTSRMTIGILLEDDEIKNFIVTWTKKNVVLHESFPEKEDSLIFKLGYDPQQPSGRVTLAVTEDKFAIGFGDNYNLKRKRKNILRLAYIKFDQLQGEISLYDFNDTFVFGKAKIFFPEAWTVEPEAKIAKLIPQYSRGGFMEMYIFSIIPSSKEEVNRILSPRKNISQVQTTSITLFQQNDLTGIEAYGKAKLLGIPINYKIICVDLGTHNILLISYLTETNTPQRLQQDVDVIFSSLVKAL